MSANELHMIAEKHHKGKVNNLSFHQLVQNIGIGSKRCPSPKGMRDCYAEQVVRKIEKYQGMINQFAEFYIVADINGPMISKNWEVNEIWNNIKEIVKKKALSTDNLSIVLMINGVNTCEYVLKNE